MDYPQPVAGPVISYAYLWRDEADEGHVDGVKPRPCVVILSVENIDGELVVTVAPITYSMPSNPTAAMQILTRLASHLGLDYNNSYLILDEYNQFTWPGFDVTPATKTGKGPANQQTSKHTW